MLHQPELFRSRLSPLCPQLLAPLASMQDKVDGPSGGSGLVTHHPGSRVSGWFAGGIDETIGAARAQMTSSARDVAS